MKSQKIDIFYMTDSIIVEFAPSMITKEEIKNRLEKPGYKFVRTSREIGSTLSYITTIITS
jgi:copper chaperone